MDDQNSQNSAETAADALVTPAAESAATPPAAGGKASTGAGAKEAEAEADPQVRSLRPLLMVWRAALAYPGHVVLALVALMITAAATLAHHPMEVARYHQAQRNRRG